MSAQDPITLEIIQDSLQAIADEMFAALRKTAMSAIIYEVLDAGTGITDAHGNLASSGAGIPGFVGVLDKAVKRIVELHGNPGDIEPGDVFITNDPYYGGVTHLNDNILMMPVFVDGRLLAWTANIAHWNDVGGMAPGSISMEAREIYQEGLRLPGVKLISRGEPVRSVIDIMTVNSRLPKFLRGDLWAGVAAVRVGARRIEDIVRKYGADTFTAALSGFMDYGEQVVLKGLASLPKGRFSIEEEQDNGLLYKATIEITDKEFIVDLRDNPPQQPGPINCSRDDCFGALQMIIKNIADPYGVANGGTFRPIRMLTTKGTVFDPEEPAAMGVYYEVGMRLYDMLWRCLAPHLGDRLPSGHFASICGTIIGGIHPDTGQRFTIIEPEVGGWGGAAGADGNNAMFSAVHGETYNCPAEVAEARYGLYVDRLALNEDSAGAGQFRGGKGVVLDYRVRSGGCFLTAAYSRNKYLPWAAHGGREGSANRIEILRADGSKEVHAVVSGLRLNRDDVIRIVTATGGGYGDPRKRDPAAIARDLRDGYITREQAARDYDYSPT
ncbi:MAG TPA: hydantoinase B/oxoprolinase family protein [Steroidobacteraceae bacterium]|nr:hydantoinase B/oxoprolinase family protein [Steroidobacteraceae bacterium]